MALTSKELKQETLEEALKGSRRTRIVTPALAAGIQYNAQLQKMLRTMRADINQELLPAIKSLESEYTADGWSDTIAAIIARLSKKWLGEQFSVWAGRTASTFVSNTMSINKKKFARSVPGMGINLFGETPSINEYLNASTAANVSLIESIPDKYLTQVETIVMSNMRSGLRSSSIAKSLQNQYGVEAKRAKFIARDQTAKIHGDITKKRQQNAGFEYFQWMTSKDELVRDRHRKLAEQDVGYGKGIYRWDDLPLSDSGEPIFPGSDFSCRCNARPVLQSEVDRNIRQAA